GVVAVERREHRRGPRPGDGGGARRVGRAAGGVAGFARRGHAARERRHADGQVDEEDGPPAEGVGQHPPASGPMAVAPPSVAPKTPSARARAAPENSARSSGVAVPTRTPPPTPSTPPNSTTPRP